MPRGAVYTGTLAHLVAMSQTLSAELEGIGINVQVLCPGLVAGAGGDPDADSGRRSGLAVNDLRRRDR
jgi:short-subunit dehydrogenase